MGKENVGKGLAIIFIGAILSIGLAGVFSDMATDKTAAPTPDTIVQAQPTAAGPSSAPSSPAPASNDKARAELEKLLQGWSKAWASQDIGSYLAFYAPDFQGNAESAEQWRANRKRILGQAEFIELKLGQAEINVESDDLATLSFGLDYASDRFEDHGTKTLQLRRDNGRWLIENEEFAAD